MLIELDKERYFLKNEQYFFEKFEFKNGAVIENAVVDYGSMGTPKYDENGNLINAILFCHGFFDDYSSIHDFDQIFGRNKLFNQEDYFIISITSLGFSKSCSPSVSELKSKFPSYEMEDLVNFQRQFIKEKFPEIKKIKGIFGYSLGGSIALGWAIYYPDDMEFVIHFASTYINSGVKYCFLKFSNKLLDNAIQNQSEIYHKSMSEGLISLSQLFYIMSFSKDYVYSLTNEEIDFSFDAFLDEGLFLDIYDLKIATDFLLSFDLSSQLDKIKCKLLVIGIENNNYSVPKYDSIPIYEAVEGSEYILLDASNKSNEAESIYKIENDIRKFVENI